MPLKGQTVTISLSACIKILAQEPEQNTGLQLSQQVHCMKWSIKLIKISKVSAKLYKAGGLVKCLLKVQHLWWLSAYWLVWDNNYFSWKLKVLSFSQVPALGEINDKHLDSGASLYSLSTWNISAGTSENGERAVGFWFSFPHTERHMLGMAESKSC